ncbi:hypothetical protein [Agrococcus beijingensis]|uniref:hypothetical protein n=1 Tax=Agrococcus beijingensis TaxID=3068634 RepID=UPI002740D4E2|nr:hypothetical protein [Agrococcus sp. REN33]
MIDPEGARPAEARPDEARPDDGWAGPEVPHAPFEVVLQLPVDDAHDRLLAALRAERLVGLVLRDASAESVGILSGAILTDVSGLAMVAGEEGLEAGLALDTIAARLSRVLGAAVQLTALSATGEPMGDVAMSVPLDFDPELAMESRSASLLEAPTLVASLVPLAADRLAPRLPELALGAGGRTTLVPAAERSIVVTEGASFPQWTKDLRPVVAMIQRDDRLELLAWLRRPVGRRRTLGERLGPMQADWALAWETRPIGIVPDDARDPAAAAALRAQDRLRVRSPMTVPDELLAELGLGDEHRTALEQLWLDDFPAVTADRLADAVAAPQLLAALASGRLAPAAAPAATVREPASIGRTVAASMRLAARPTGDGRWARMERWWLDRPRLSIGVGIGMVLLAAAAIVAVQLVPEQLGVVERGPWWHYLAMALVAINGVATIVTGVIGLRTASDPRRSGERLPAEPEPDRD